MAAHMHYIEGASTLQELDKELKEEEELAAKAEGNASFQKLLQSIYWDADDNTKRAMIKSYM